MTIMERLEQVVRLHKSWRGDYVGVSKADLAALLECVRMQWEWITKPMPTSPARFAAEHERRLSAVAKAQKKVGLKP